MYIRTREGLFEERTFGEKSAGSQMDIQGQHFLGRQTASAMATWEHVWHDKGTIEETKMTGEQ